MRSVTVLHTFTVDDDATEEQIRTLAWCAAVQIEDPADGEGGSADFSTADLSTVVTLDGLVLS